MKRECISILLIAAFINITACGRASNGCKIEKETFVFAIKGADTLSLDKYENVSLPATSPKPVLLFAFGGGFKAGNKANKEYIPYFNFLAENGYVVVSTDYRVGLKGLKAEKTRDPQDFVVALQNAIGMAVEDFFDATRFIIDKNKEWNINPQSVIACGSSAGAVTCLQAEYEICNRTELTKRLSESFNYAGVVSFAGAIAAIGQPSWPQKPCPIMLFHGDADRTVPFEKAVMGDVGLWGSAAIAKQLDELQTPYYFYKVENAGHEMAGVPLSDNRYDILSFLTKMVIRQEKLIIHTDVKKIGQEEVKKDFTLLDYIQNQ